MGGAFSSQRTSGVETVDISNNAYRYPPKTGSYFGSHFIMGGERFDSPQPGEYLFGENEDLNFLGNKPYPFPYPVPPGNEPTKTLKSLVYIRKDSLRLVKVPAKEKLPLDQQDSASLYNIEFTFDSDVRCAITIYYFATEEMSSGQILFHTKDNSLTSETFHYKRGAGQQFSQSGHMVDPSKFPDEEWQYNPEKEVIPIVIQCVVEEEEHLGHSHMTFAVIEKSADGGYSMKPLKQKQYADGLCYLLQEIYGIENKNMERSKLDPDDELEDSGAECVICMSETKDTLILPCRHLCLCSVCAESLRYQASTCPICRAKFRALLQIQAMRKKPPNTGQQTDTGEENPVSQEGVPPGYEAISLMEVLNGQVVPQPGQNDGPLQVCLVPPSNALFLNEKKGHKGSQVPMTTPIEYQKEMDTDKENSDPPNKGGEKEGVLERGTSPKKLMPESPGVETEVNVKHPALPEAMYPLDKDSETTTADEPEQDYTESCEETDIDAVPPKPIEKKVSPSRSGLGRDEALKLYSLAVSQVEAESESGSNLTPGISTGDMADDEHEDSSEPDPDYDDEEDDVEEEEEEEDDEEEEEGSVRRMAKLGVLVYEGEEGQGKTRGRYRHLEATSGGSSTEASSYGSNSSSQALLTHPEDDKLPSPP